MGRVLGSLCVLTSRDDDAESGMLASWVSTFTSIKHGPVVMGLICRK